MTKQFLYPLLSTVFFALFCLSAPLSMAKDKGKKSRLDFEKIHYSQLSPFADVASVYRQKDQLITLPLREKTLFVANYLPDDKNFIQDAMFEIAAGERLALEKTLPEGHWRGLWPHAKGLWLLLDGVNMGVAAVDLEKKAALISYRNIVMDLLRPAKDSRGEPTKKEIGAAQAKLVRELNGLRGAESVLLGAAAMPSRWREGEKHDYLMLTRLPSFPLVTLQCEESDVTQCRLVRNCFSAALPAKNAKSRQGLAISAKRDWLLVGDREEHLIHVFKFQSCFNVRHIKTIELPDQLKKLRSLFVDGEDQLWLTTEAADNYRNASVYVWREADW